jgi:hypothetical protein
MITFTTDDANDFLVSGRSLSLSNGVLAISMVCKHAAKALLGEMMFAANQGMPYFQTVWVGAPTTAPFEAAFRDRIPQIDGVTGISELTTSQVGETMTYSATISTIYGEVSISG